MKKIIVIALSILPILTFAQKSKVQTAWRALNDYESTMFENLDISHLNKAKENIEIALTDEVTKVAAKTHAIKARTMYNFYLYNCKQEEKKTVATITDKNERAEAAYVSTSTVEYDEAVNSLLKIKEVDLKYFDKTLGPTKKESQLSDDDLKLYLASNQLIITASNIAIANYKAKKFNEAAVYFHKSANLSLNLNGIKDTTSFYNACICSQKSGNSQKIVFYNTEMINNNISTPLNYHAIYEALLNEKDTIKANDYLKRGREAFPNDLFLMNKETENFIKSGKQDLAVINLKKAIEKDPTNALLEFVLADVYNAIANPKGKDGQDTVKPANYEELLLTAEEHYLKSINLKPAAEETLFSILFNFGAMHYNHGVVLYSKSIAKSSIVDLVRKQKDYEIKSMEFYKKAIPYFEQALSIKKDDVSTLTILRKLYHLCGNEAKGNEMNAKLKAINK